jgi:hypothetical protein
MWNGIPGVGFGCIAQARAGLAGKNSQPTAAIIDSQSVKTAGQGDVRGYNSCTQEIKCETVRISQAMRKLSV